MAKLWKRVRRIEKSDGSLLHLKTCIKRESVRKLNYEGDQLKRPQAARLTTGEKRHGPGHERIYTWKRTILRNRCEFERFIRYCVGNEISLI